VLVRKFWLGTGKRGHSARPSLGTGSETLGEDVPTHRDATELSTSGPSPADEGNASCAPTGRRRKSGPAAAELELRGKKSLVGSFASRTKGQAGSELGSWANGAAVHSCESNAACPEFAFWFSWLLVGPSFCGRGQRP
jgi:hypothetical protein